MGYLISETTREEREKLVYKALGISLSDADYPSEKVMLLVRQYIDGKMELDHIQKLIIEFYQKEGGCN
ncbi:MAG: hypothetical protein IJG68_06010 [Bacilli bacterium]|nr:hypothetical protein [Bacilli bacterium]